MPPDQGRMQYAPTTAMGRPAPGDAGVCNTPLPREMRWPWLYPCCGEACRGVQGPQVMCTWRRDRRDTPAGSASEEAATGMGRGVLHTPSFRCHRGPHGRGVLHTPVGAHRIRLSWGRVAYARGVHQMATRPPSGGADAAGRPPPPGRLTQERSGRERDLVGERLSLGGWRGAELRA
jgi:hypothetical protein